MCFTQHYRTVLLYKVSNMQRPAVEEGHICHFLGIHGNCINYTSELKISYIHDVKYLDVRLPELCLNRILPHGLSRSFRLSAVWHSTKLCTKKTNIIYISIIAVEFLQQLVRILPKCTGCHLYHVVLTRLEMMLLHGFICIGKGLIEVVPHLHFYKNESEKQ